MPFKLSTLGAGEESLEHRAIAKVRPYSCALGSPASFPGFVTDSSAEVRLARAEDLGSIAAIYAHYVEHTYVTFELQARTLEAWSERWDAAQRTRHPWFVSELAGELAGFSTASEFRAYAAYRSTVETTIYIAPRFVGRRLGRELYAPLLGELSERGFHTAVAAIALPNAASVALHEALGFKTVGVLDEVGFKLGAWRDVGYWQRRL